MLDCMYDKMDFSKFVNTINFIRELKITNNEQNLVSRQKFQAIFT